MALKVKFEANAKPFIKSIKRMISGFEKDVPKAMQMGGKEVAKNIKERFNNAYGTVNSDKALAVPANIDASAAHRNGDDLYLGIGNIPNLDKATEVRAQASGNVYHLWSLMEYGFGMKGASSDSNKGLYDIYPVPPNTVLTFVGRDGEVVHAAHVRHPGAEGRHFFLEASRNWYAEDREEMIKAIGKTVEKLIEKNSYRGS